MAPPSPTHIILASNSPRRAALLRDAGYSFEVVLPDPDREGGPLSGESAEAHVRRLAIEKARQVVEKLADAATASGNLQAITSRPDPLVLAADTVAECEGDILGKPVDRDHARRILQRLRGRPHRVLTGLCLWDISTGRQRTEIDVTTLQMSPLADGEIEEYLDTDRWRGKAGAFGYQDGNDWVRIIEGSPSNVVGLPLELLQRMLREF